MAEPVRFFFDQHQRNSIVKAIHRRGGDALTAHEAGRCGKADPHQLRAATTEGRAVVTFDSDFLVLASDFNARGESFAGVIYCEPRKYMHDPRRQIRDLLILYGVLNADDMIDHVEFL